MLAIPFSGKGACQAVITVTVVCDEDYGSLGRAGGRSAEFFNHIADNGPLAVPVQYAAETSNPCLLEFQFGADHLIAIGKNRKSEAPHIACIS